MNENFLRLLNTSMQLLRTVQDEVDTNALSKDFWITLGICYNAYQSFMELPEVKSGLGLETQPRKIEPSLPDFKVDENEIPDNYKGIYK